MQPSFCDGLSVSYANSDSNAEPRRSCTTQSVDGSGDYSTLDSFYSPSPALQVAETTQQPAQHQQQPAPAHYLPAINTAAAAQTFPLPQTHSAASSQGMWPTPPSTACDDYEDHYSYHSPAGASCGIPIASCSNRSSATSPRSWSSPDVQQLSFQHVVWKGQEQQPPYNMRIATIPSEERFHHQMVASPYASSAFLSSDIDQDSMMNQEAPPMTPDNPEPALTSRSASPVMKQEFGVSYPFDEDDVPQHLGQGDGGSEGEDVNKVDEPYAQLIYRAFMSRERHAMTLQEIYQWFRENTDKSKSETKGWQNSIRHNLSMNAAFVKRDRRPSSNDPTTESGESKKSTEWVLEDWAVEGGVQSTTRYRKGNSSRRGGSGLHTRSHRDSSFQSLRANSGRRGGLTASKTKAAALRLGQQRNPSARAYLGSQYQLPYGSSYRHPDEGYGSRDEPVTPPDASPGGMLFTDTIAGPSSISTNSSQGYYSTGASHPHSHHIHHHPHHYQHHSSHSGNPVYSLENVSGVYEPPPPQSAPSARQPQGYNMLFADEGRDEAPESSVRVASININYGWSNGEGPTPYQS